MAEPSIDVCVVGAGVAGVACAQGLARQGVSVLLLDRLHPLPACLKGEKLESDAVPALLRLGFRAVVDGVLTPLHTVGVYFGERNLGTMRLDPPEAAIHYQDLVNSLREHMDRRIDFRPGVKATAFEQQEDAVLVKTDKGESIRCRLVVMATGDARQLLENLGAHYEPMEPRQVFVVGFDMAGTLGTPGATLDSVTYHNPIPGGPVAYATFFRIGSIVRGNIFCPGEVSDEWQRKLKQAPLETLSAHNRPIAEAARAWRIVSSTVVRKVNVARMSPPSLPRMVVLGDAAHTIDPSGSGGLTFSLLDAELLIKFHLPEWLRQNDFGLVAIKHFYRDPRRVAATDEFFGRGRYIFALNHDSSWMGNWRRFHFALQNKLAARSTKPVRTVHETKWPVAAPFLYEHYSRPEPNTRPHVAPKRPLKVSM